MMIIQDSWMSLEIAPVAQRTFFYLWWWGEGFYHQTKQEETCMFTFCCMDAKDPLCAGALLPTATDARMRD